MRLRAVQERRRSNAAGPHNTRPTRGVDEHTAIDEQLDDVDEPEPVDLDAVVGAELQRAARIEDSPLYGRARLFGRIVTDPDELADIGACIAYGKLPFWKRWGAPAPKGWKR